MLQFELLGLCESEDDLKDEAGRLADRIGFELWALSCVVQTGRRDDAQVWSIGNFPCDLDEARLGCLARRTAAPMSERERHGIPQCWLIGRAELPEQVFGVGAEAFRERALRNGVRGGLLVPAPATSRHCTLMLATRRRVSDGTLREAQPSAALFSRHLHLACMPLIERFCHGLRPQLRAREVECLSWAAMGKTTWEISRLLRISEHTVVFHLRNACVRLDAVNRQQAIARAIELGVLLPSGEAGSS